MEKENQKPFTREEFIAHFNSKSQGKSGQELIDSGEMVALPCACGDDGCRGWAMVSNNPLSIKSHNELYNPETMNKENEKALTIQQAKSKLFNTTLINLPDNGGDVFETMHVMRYINAVENCFATHSQRIQELESQLAEWKNEAERLIKSEQHWVTRYNEKVHQLAESQRETHSYKVSLEAMAEDYWKYKGMYHEAQDEIDRLAKENNDLRNGNTGALTTT